MSPFLSDHDGVHEANYSEGEKKKDSTVQTDMGMCANESNLPGCHSLLNSTGKFVPRIYCVDT